METDNFQLSEEQTMILDTVRKFAQEQVEPKALDNDEHCVFVRESFDGLAELGMLGIPLSEESGGAEMGLLSLVVALEELGRTCGSSARLLLSQTALGGMAVEGHASAEDIASGEKLAAFVGLDAGITATADGDGFVLDGCAEPVTAGTKADILVVAARTVEGTPVIACLSAADSATREDVVVLGFRASAPGRITFAKTAATADTIVATGEAADTALHKVHVAACIGAGAVSVGMGEASLVVAAAHSKERIAFGKPLAKQQAVALKIVDSTCALTAARHLVYHAARLHDSGRDARSAANMAKLAAVSAAITASDESIQILGGYGYVVEYHAERHYRDAMTLGNLDCGAEALRMELA